MSSVAIPRHDVGLAPSDLLSTVAHELRQPLSNIEAIAYHLGLVIPKDNRKIQEQLERIRELVQQSNEILCSHLRAAGALPPSPSQPADPVAGA